MKNLSFIIVLRYFVVVICILLCNLQETYSAKDTTTILQIFKFDDDCLLDTLMGKKIFNGHRTHIVPVAIRWGWGVCDGNAVSSGLRETQFRFPDWHSLSVMTFHDKMNNDEIQDLVLRVKGKVRTSIDTSRFLVIFGQNALRHLPIIDLSLIDTNANMPLIVRELQKGKQIVEPQKHDLSGGTMWKLQRFDVKY